MNAIDLPKLRNAEYLQYMKDFAGIINLNDPASLQITAKLTAFTAKTDELEDLFKKALANDRTRVILQLDERREMPSTVSRPSCRATPTITKPIKNSTPKNCWPIWPCTAAESRARIISRKPPR